MKVLACVAGSFAVAVLLLPLDSNACSFARTAPSPVRPVDGAQDVPLNARIYLAGNGGSLESADHFAFVRLDPAGTQPIPFTIEALPFTSSTYGRLRLTPDAQLNPDATYAVCFWDDSGDAGTGACPEPDRVLTFTTGTTTETGAPASAEGLALEVASQDFPDAGPNLFCSGPRRVRGISVEVPDGGSDLLYFARAGDAGIFSAVPGAWLPNGIYTVDSRAAGILDCDGKGHTVDQHGWGVPAGTSALEVWTEDVAGNASTPQTIPLHGDCSQEPAQEIDHTRQGEGSPTGCTGSGGAPGILALIAIGLTGMARRRASHP